MYFLMENLSQFILSSISEFKSHTAFFSPSLNYGDWLSQKVVGMRPSIECLSRKDDSQLGKGRSQFGNNLTVFQQHKRADAWVAG